MAEKLITKKAVNQVISDYWVQLRSFPFQTLIALFSPGFGNIFVFYVPPLIIAKLIDIFNEKQQILLSDSLGYIFLFAGGWLIGEIFWRVGIHFIIKIETKGINNLSKKSFSLLAERDYDFYSNNFVGTLTKKAASYSRNFETVTDTLSFNIVSEILPVFFVFFVLWRYSPWIPTILLFCLSILVFIAIPLIKKRVKLVTERHDASSKMVGRLSDSLTNILAVKSFAKENQEYKIFGKHVDKFTNKFKQTADFQNLRYDSIVSPFYVFTNAIGLFAAIFFAQSLNLNAGAIVVVFSYYAQITRIFWNISKIYRNTESSISEAAEFTQLFVDPPSIKDIDCAKDLKVIDGNISFSDVNFKYCDNGKDGECFLNNFSLDIKKKEKVGLVGPSGGGKTTITKMILRFIDSESGEITIDNQPIKEVTQISLREAISYVPQEPLLFHRSLLENISYGDENASKKDILKAAKIAHADEFINLLPEGYNTLVGER